MDLLQPGHPEGSHQLPGYQRDCFGFIILVGALGGFLLDGLRPNKPSISYRGFPVDPFAYLLGFGIAALFIGNNNNYNVMLTS